MSGEINPLLRRSFPEVDIGPENRSLDTKRDDFDFHLPMGVSIGVFLKILLKNLNLMLFLYQTQPGLSIGKED